MKSKTTADLPSLRDLIAAGAHYGHRRERSTPAARQYTFLVRDGVVVINLEDTQKQLVEAAKFLERSASQGKVILLVGTKRQAQEAIKQAAEKTSLPYVAKRWMGGTLTNFDVISLNIKRLAELSGLLNNETELAKKTKRERHELSEDVKRLEGLFGGIRALTQIPDVLVVVDPHEEATAVREARRMGVPVVAICDSDADPNIIDIPIPANDDAPKTIALILDYLAAAMERGKEKASK